ncbi:MAG: flavodoxin domain-containing protein [Candidatus Bathyarchaeia archaeon]
MKIVIIYESKYGNTERVAEMIAEGLKETVGTEVSLQKLKEADLDKITDYDVILLGSPNHMGGPARSVKGFIDMLGKLRLEGKKFAVFDTYMGKDFEKAVKKMEKRISEKSPGLKKAASGLSIKVQGIKGPIVEGELQKCREFGRKIAAQLKSG